MVPFVIFYASMNLYDDIGYLTSWNFRSAKETICICESLWRKEICIKDFHWQCKATTWWCKYWLHSARLAGLKLLAIRFWLLFVIWISEVSILTLKLWFLATKYQLHAKEVAKSLDILRYDGVVCVSGDGILVEVGLFFLFLFIIFFNGWLGLLLCVFA